MSANAPNDVLAAAVAAASEALVLRELATLYAGLESELTSLGAPCGRCGRCCDFGTFGHRLYVTPIELAMLTQEPPGDRNPGPLRCPYQVDGQCTAHQRRTLGCRVFFCGAAADQEQALYERYHAELRALHDRHRVPYLYVELTCALRG